MSLILVLLLAGATTAGGEETAVVERLYAYVVSQHPLGIPPETDQRTLEPLLTKRLLSVLEAGRLCEADYFRKHQGGDGKPEFLWLELGLFSGRTEMAIPAEYRIVRSERSSSGAWRVIVKLTYRDTPATYCCRPPDPKNTFSWQVVVLLRAEVGRVVVDDVIHRNEASAPGNWRLSETFAECRGSVWIGEKR